MTCGCRTKLICHQWNRNIPLARSNSEALVLENPMNTVALRLELLHIHKHKNVDIDSVVRLKGRRLTLCL